MIKPIATSLPGLQDAEAALQAWGEANDAADEAGRAALAGLRAALVRLADLSSTALEEGRRGPLKARAEQLERALRAAVHQTEDVDKERLPRALEFRDSELIEEVLRARREGTTARREGTAAGVLRTV
jgi:hypothetical protein